MRESLRSEFLVTALLLSVATVHENTGNAEIAPTVHPAGRVSFVEMTDRITYPPNPQTFGLRVRGLFSWWVIFSTKLTHTSWCRNCIESHTTRYHQDPFRAKNTKRDINLKWNIK